MCILCGLLLWNSTWLFQKLGRSEAKQSTGEEDVLVWGDWTTLPVLSCSVIQQVTSNHSCLFARSLNISCKQWMLRDCWKVFLQCLTEEVLTALKMFGVLQWNEAVWWFRLICLNIFKINVDCKTNENNNGHGRILHFACSLKSPVLQW